MGADSREVYLFRGSWMWGGLRIVVWDESIGNSVDLGTGNIKVGNTGESRAHVS